MSPLFSSIFDNAVAALKMGVEDYEKSREKPERSLSAARNFYAGLLLLIKAALLYTAPKADGNVLLAQKVKLVSDKMGGAKTKEKGNATISFQDIKERIEDFKLPISPKDLKNLEALQKIRNDLEHHYTKAHPHTIRATMAKGFPIVTFLFRYMRKEPLEFLGEAWSIMLSVQDLYNKELKAARKSFSKINWHSPTFQKKHLACPECSSELVEQHNPKNMFQEDIKLHCRECGANPDLEQAIIDCLNVSRDYYEDALCTCPSCGVDALEERGQCAFCGEAFNYQNTCVICGDSISIRDALDLEATGLCSYHAYTAEQTSKHGNFHHTRNVPSH